jgi:Holliday junction DNA helicase RuvA
LALFGAEDAGEVACVLAAKFRGVGVDRVHEESSACQETIVMGRRALQYKLMIALLRGILIEKHPNQAIVETGGVGYDVAIPVSTFTRLPDAGAEVRLRIHTHVREDALALYGFLTQDEKALFEKLIGVGGIGPTLAVKVLSGLAAADLIHAIRRGEVERLVRIPGVGKKTAERMVLELRDKLPAVSGEETAAAPETLSLVDQDVLSALLNLGCARPHAEAAVRKAKAAGGAAEFEPLFRRALELVR